MESTDIIRYGEDALSLIQNSQILTKEDFGKIDLISAELSDAFIHSQIFRTRTEMEISVLDNIKHPTPDSKYWQSNREQNVHFEELVRLSFEHRRNEIKLRQNYESLVEETDSTKKALILVDIDEKEFNRKVMEKIAKDRIREIWNWHEIKERLKKEMLHSLTDCDEHQLVSYALRWIYQTMNMGTGGTPGERNNLIGQLRTGLKRIKAEGLEGKIQEWVGSHVFEWLKQNFPEELNASSVRRIK